MMKKLSVVLVGVVLFAFVLAGCGGAGKSENTMETAGASADVTVARNADTQVTFNEPIDRDINQTKVSGAEKKADGKASSVTGSGIEGQTSTNAILAQRKVIRNAGVTMEVEDFDDAYMRLKSMINPFGYVQESSIKKEKDYSGEKEKLITRGTIIIRVDSDRFDSVLDGINGLGLVTDINIKGDDVTDKYYDVESQLRLLKYEQSRLEEYLNKITDPDTIFKTESRLTDIRHQIESLTGNLNKMDNLVKLSTITISMSEKRDAPPEVKPAGYWEKLGSGFTNSVKDVVGFLGELLLFLTAALPVLVLLGVFALIGFMIYRKTRRKINKTISKDDDGVGM